MIFFPPQNEKKIFFPDGPSVLETTDPGDGKAKYL